MIVDVSLAAVDDVGATWKAEIVGTDVVVIRSWAESDCLAPAPVAYTSRTYSTFSVKPAKLAAVAVKVWVDGSPVGGAAETT